MEETARKIKENASCWYAVYTAPRAEKKVKEQLDKIGVENYLPLQPVVRFVEQSQEKRFSFLLFRDVYLCTSPLRKLLM